MEFQQHEIPTPDGWTLAARRGLVASAGGSSAPAAGPPVVIIPGYGMNSFIFGYHPTGRSFMQALVEGGYDAWTADLRGQGDSRRTESVPRRLLPDSWGLREYAFVDVKAVLDHVARVTGHERVVAVGCSLGGALLYAYAARFGTSRLDRLVIMGGPLEMVDTHPLVTAAGFLGHAIGMVPMRGIRPLARQVLPFLVDRAPRALSIYLNSEIVDLSRVDVLTQAVENPKRQVNRELARWIRRRRLVVDGMDVGEGLRGLSLPTLIVVALGDGIVNPASCRSVRRYLAPDVVDELTVGGPDLHVAHADLFVSEVADELVFQPIVRWLDG